jgi:hypothetical protein
MPTASPSASAWSTRLHQALVLLGWLGLALFIADELVDDWAFETTSRGLLRTFDIVKSGLFALWPVSLWLQAEHRLTGTMQDVANLGLCLLLFPWWAYCGFMIMMEDQAPWQDEAVFYTSTNPPVRVVRQYKSIFVTTSISYRVVKLTPLGPWWQHVEPADPTHFPLN